MESVVLIILLVYLSREEQSKITREITAKPLEIFHVLEI
jgi:hypothetical protein